MKFLSRIILVTLTLSVLSGCSSLNRVFRQDEDTLPGRRIPLQVNGGDATTATTRVARVDPPRARANWTQAGSSANNASPHVNTDRALEQLWVRDIGVGTRKDATIVAQPLIVQGVVFSLDSRSLVRASSLNSGQTLWERNVKPSAERGGYFGGGIAYEGGAIYVATGFGELIALKARDGAEQWRRQLPGISHGAPTVANGRVYAQTAQNKTRAYAAANGQFLWDHKGQEERTGILGSAAPAVSGDRVVVGYSSGEVFVLEAGTGQEIWSDTLAVSATGSLTSDIGDITAQPVIAGPTVYVSSNTGRTAAFDLNRGALLWEAAVGGSQTPVVSGNAVFLVTGDSVAVALDRSNGGIIWRTQLQKSRERFLRSKFPLSWKGPILAGGRLMFGSSLGQVQSLNPQNGASLGEMKLRGPVAVAPSAGQGFALFLTDKAKLVALR